MGLYRKRPVVITAYQFVKGNADVIMDFIGYTLDQPKNTYSEIVEISIPTLEGVMTAQVGDYIIKGIQGEFYPCKEDIFLATYEAV